MNFEPLDLLDSWLAGLDYTSPPLMALATVTSAGQPRVRHVLLSSYDRGRLHFHTDSRSAKAAELAQDPRASVTLVWPETLRQLAVEGHVVAETEAEQAAAYARRSRYLQLLAWNNQTGCDRAAWAKFDAEHPRLEPPPTWAGYALVAERISFWCGASDAPSQRLACQLAGSGWTSERLPG